MQLSARNQSRGTVTKLVYGAVMAEVTIAIGDNQEIVAAITKASAEQLNLREGAEAIAVIKATEVLVATP
ncbi:MAG: TOBE domain-containing protein [Chloroflexota bacterium]|nr:TOBE domain-containing protein [Chloroflexota bacterium]